MGADRPPAGRHDRRRADVPAVLGERARPGSLIVDGSGRRFVDESQNYNDLGRTLQDFDAATFSYRHVPAWLVFDADYRSRHRVFTITPDDPRPGLARPGRHARRARGADRRSGRRARRDASTGFNAAGARRRRPGVRPGRATPTTASSASSARSARARSSRSRSCPGASAPRAARAPTRTAACSSAADGIADHRPLRGRQRRGEPVRARLPRRRRHDRPGARLRPARRRGGGNRRPDDPRLRTGGGGSAGRPSIAARRRSPPSAARARSRAMCRRSSTRAARRPWPRARARSRWRRR